MFRERERERERESEIGYSLWAENNFSLQKVAVILENRFF